MKYPFDSLDEPMFYVVDDDNNVHFKSKNINECVKFMQGNCREEELRIISDIEVGGVFAL